MNTDEVPELGKAFFENAILTNPGESVIAVVEEARASKARREFQDLVSWLRDHKGDVNHSAFVAACSAVLHKALQEASLRRPHGLPEGYPTLDLAAALLRTYIPGDVMFHTLPGYYNPETEPVA